MIRCFSVILTLVLSACSTIDVTRHEPLPGADVEAATHPVIPLNTNFWSYWSHYWTTWLPEHPVYEMIELTAYENPEDPTDYLVRVFLTEREGRKQQYFYLNDESEVRRTRANAYYRDIAYRRSGTAGGPQNLHVRFADKDEVPIEWTITFPADAQLRTYGEGLTPSIHSLGAVLLLALRTQTVDTHQDRILFDGVDYAADLPPGDPTPGTRSWHNPDYYSAILLFGRLQFSHGNGGAVSNSWGRVFSPLPDEPLTYRSNLLGPDNYVQFKLDAAGRMTSYAHVSRGHSLDFAFEPALFEIAGVKDGESARFDVSFDQHRKLMTGRVTAQRDATNKVVLHWVPDAPEWALGRDFWSVIEFNEEGYTLVFTGQIPN